MNVLPTFTDKKFAATASHRPMCRAHGFTLIELMVGLTVTLVLLIVATPSMGSIIDSVWLTSATNEFMADVQLARTEAIKRNSRVALCKSADGASCVTSGGWEQGWIVFHDTNNNGLADPGEPVLARQSALSRRLRATGNQNVVRYISFSSNGAAKLLDGAFQAGTLTLCRQSPTSNEARQIILNAVGRPRVQRLQIASCA
jgi:type IV fimbrial biogenesis protein FimT